MIIEHLKHLVAVSISDLHLSSRPTILRSVEPDWMRVQENYLGQINDLVWQKKKTHLGRSQANKSVPLIVVGDVFDHPDPGAAVVNLALRSLPEKVYAIPGQHDIHHHRLDSLPRTAYATLVESGKIIDISPDEPVVLAGDTPARLWGFPWGVSVVPCPDPHDLYLEIAVVHSYIFTRSTGYEGAPEEKKLGAYRKKLTGYDVALFGDNHTHFMWNTDRKREDEPAVFNHGSFLRRKKDEKNNKPCACMIYSDGSVEPHYLDVSGDNFLDVDSVDEIMGRLAGADDFVGALMELGDAALSFGDVLRRLVDSGKVGDTVKKIILDLLEKHKK